MFGEDDKPREQSFVERVLELKHKEPFEKFRIVMASGSSHLIEHPDLLALGATRLHYCVPRSDRVIEMRLNQITELETTREFLGDRNAPQPSIGR